MPKKISLEQLLNTFISSAAQSFSRTSVINVFKYHVSCTDGKIPIRIKNVITFIFLIQLSGTTVKPESKGNSNSDSQLLRWKLRSRLPWRCFPQSGKKLSRKYKFAIDLQALKHYIQIDLQSTLCSAKNYCYRCMRSFEALYTFCIKIISKAVLIG